jgi:hypothetical protein
MKLNINNMRDQSIELLRIAKELRDYVTSLNLPMDKDANGNSVGIHVRVSNNIRMHYNSLHEYASIEFSNWPKTVNVALFESSGYANNTVTINVELLDDAELEAIILLVQSDIAIFMHSKVHKQDAVYTSTSSI